MKTILSKFKSISKIQILAFCLVLFGLVLMVSKGLGMLEFYKEVRYANENNFSAGNLSPDLLRPWMTIRYISVAYAVPQAYLFENIGIQPKEENSMIALNRLNGKQGLGQANGRPAIMNTIHAAIDQYRAAPVVTGLIEKRVTDWMSVQYIANSIGLPAETIFQELGIPMDGNAYIPIGYLSDANDYEGGPKALVAAVQKIVDSHPVQP